LPHKFSSKSIHNRRFFTWHVCCGIVSSYAAGLLVFFVTHLNKIPAESCDDARLIFTQLHEESTVIILVYQ